MIGYRDNFWPMEIPKKGASWQKMAQERVQKARAFWQYFSTRQYSSRTLTFLFLLALGAGVLIKSLVNDSLTIGFDDYRLSRGENRVNLNTLEKELIQNGGSEATKQAATPGETCAESEQNYSK